MKGAEAISVPAVVLNIQMAVSVQWRVQGELAQQMDPVGPERTSAQVPGNTPPPTQEPPEIGQVLSAKDRVMGDHPYLVTRAVGEDQLPLEGVSAAVGGRGGERHADGAEAAHSAPPAERPAPSLLPERVKTVFSVTTAVVLPTVTGVSGVSRPVPAIEGQRCGGKPSHEAVTIPPSIGRPYGSTMKYWMVGAPSPLHPASRSQTSPASARNSVVLAIMGFPPPAPQRTPTRKEANWPAAPGPGVGLLEPSGQPALAEWQGQMPGRTLEG